MFLRYDWLVKHNPEVDQNKGTIQFIRCPRTCRTKHQNISFTPRNQRTWATDNNNKEQQEIGKKPDPTNPEDLPDYIRPITHLFNKKKFKKLLERQKWNHEINLIEKVPRELNAKAYALTIKENETLNQWLDKQLKAGLIKESKSRYAVPCFYIPKKNRSLWLVQDYWKLNQVTIKDKTLLLSSSQIVNLVFSLFLFFIFIFIIFLFLEQLGLGLEVISHTVTSVTI